MRRKLGCLESFHKATSFLITYFLSQSLITPLEKPIYWESCDRVTLIVYETPIDLLFMSRGKHSVDFCSDFPSVGNKGSQTSLLCCSAAQSYPTLCNPVECSMPGLPVPHHLLEFAQVHVHCIGIHPLLLPSIFPSIRDFSNDSAVLIRWPKYWSFSFSMSPSSEYSGLISLQSKGLSGVFSSTTFWRHQFFSALSSLKSSSHNCTWPLGRP